jgi:hypothetical protein
MHGYSDTMPFDEVPDLPKLVLKKDLPVKLTDGVGGKGNQVGGDPKKEDVVFHIKPENFLGTVQVILDSSDQAFLGVGLEAKCPITLTAQTQIYARVPYFHRKESLCRFQHLR